MGMRVKGETLDEITGAVMVMRDLASGVNVGGDTPGRYRGYRR